MSGGTTPTPYSLLEALERQTTGYIHALQNLGYTKDQIIERLRTRGRGLGINQARAAYDRAERAINDAINVNFGGSQAVAAAGDYNKGLPGQTGYRYYSVVYVRTEAGHVMAVPVTEHAAKGLSRAAIHELARQQVLDMAGDSEDAAGDKYDLRGEITIVSVTVYAAERALPP